ncbi:hypothetical protein [Halohasta litorea]|uniref:Uncharacterized protein n=1 Tax=Halohasta litorea TaxID=869891 RepID=A0ABD6D9J5_9EURY|nr:hypothetical protein [Halohasta litorea]
MSDAAPSDRLEDRTAGSRYWIRLLIAADRWLLVAVILAGIFSLLVVTSQLGLAPLREIAATQNGVRYLFSPFIGAIITGTSIVVTINQLVLSQELGAVGDQRNRMQESMEFQTDVESKLGVGVSNPEPAAFLDQLLDGIDDRATRLGETMTADHDAERSNPIDDLVEDVTRNAETVRNELDGAQFGTFEVMLAALNFNYSWKIYAARRIQHHHGESLSTEADEALDELLSLLKFFGEAREHFKTLYFQWELINLSRALLYIAVPALAVVGVFLMYVDATTLYGTTLGVDNLVWLASAGFALGVAPFVVFIVFILRIATVAKHTLAMGPFILRETEREGDVE